MKIKLKKVISLTMAIIMMVSVNIVAPQEVKANNSQSITAESIDREESHFTYTINGGKATITNYTGSGKIAVIPTQLGGSEVATIAADAFNGKTGLEGVYIPSTVTTIAEKSIGYNVTDPIDGFVVYATKGTEGATYAIQYLTINFIPVADTYGEIITDHKVSECWIGDTFEVSVLLDPIDAGDIYWESEDSTVVSVEHKQYSGGRDIATVKILGKNAKGTCKIYAKNLAGDIVKELTLTLLKPASEIKTYLNGEEYTDDILYLDIDEEFSLEVDFGTDNDEAVYAGGGVSGTYTYFDTSIDGYTVTLEGKKNTSAINGGLPLTLQGVSGRVSRTIQVVVLQEATKIQILSGKTDITGGGLSMVAGKAAMLSSKLTPTTTTDKVKWYSDNTSVVSISEDDGILTAKRAGTANITAKAHEVSGTKVRELVVETMVTVNERIVATAITFPDKEKTMVLGTSETFKYDIVPAKANDELTWVSSDTTVASVDQTGLITPRKKGTTTITVKTEDERVYSSCIVTVKTPVTSIELQPSSKTLPVGQSYQLTAKIGPNTADETLIWESSAPEYVSVDQKGEITAIKLNNGQNAYAMITCKSEQTEVKAIANITVVPAIPATSVNISTTTEGIKTYEDTDGITVYELPIYNKIDIQATVTPEDSNDVLKWIYETENDSKGAADYITSTISGKTGTITALKDPGIVKVRVVTTSGQEDVCKIKIIIPAVVFEISADYFRLGVGVSTQLSASSVKLLPATTTDSITWISSDPSVATISGTTKTPVITAHKIGTAIITGTTDSGLTDTIEVKVVVPSKSIVFSVYGKEVTTYSMKSGDSVNASINVLPLDTTDSFSWSAKNDAIVSIEPSADNKTAKLTGLSKGTTTIEVVGTDGVKSILTIKVVEPATGIILKTTETEINSGKTYTMTATKTPSTSDDVITWESSNTNIVSITATNANTNTATLKGGSAGVATITARSEAGGAVAIAQITVIANVSTLTIDKISDQTYTGSAINPKLVVKSGETLLTENVDYTVAYTNNIKYGTARATITGMGVYTGTKYVSFKIVKKSIQSLSFGTIANRVYTGSSIKQTPVVRFGSKTLVLNTDYTVSYSNNTNAGTATVKITGNGNYTGTKNLTFRIIPISLAKYKYTKVATQTYRGSAIKPLMTVKNGTRTLSSSRDYNITYKNNKKTGAATIVIKGKGNYTGTKTIKFNIKPKAPTVSKLRSTSKKKMKLSWKKDSQVTGYQIQYSLKSNFKSKKTITIKKKSTKSKTISKLKSGKTYYVRMRSYKTINRKKVYSTYSSSKIVKVK